MDIDEELERLRKFQGIIIVEGEKDKKALEQLGIRNIIHIKGPLYKTVDQVAEKWKACIILTDLDQEGKKIYSSLKKALERRKIKVNDRFRNFLFRHTSLRQIEGLDTYMENQEE